MHDPISKYLVHMDIKNTYIGVAWWPVDNLINDMDNLMKTNTIHHELELIWQYNVLTYCSISRRFIFTKRKSGPLDLASHISNISTLTELWAPVRHGVHPAQVK